jgi:hypothetical protein
MNGRILLKWIMEKWYGRALTRLIWLRTGKSGGCCESGNYLSGVSKCREFLD